MNEQRHGTRSPFGLMACTGAALALSFLASTLRLEAASFRPIDLAQFCTQTNSSILSSLGLGEKTFENVPFTISGAVQVTGLDAARRGQFWPLDVRAIPVNAKARQLHLLLGAHHGQRDGVPLANVVLNFKNGESRALRLAFGVHTRNATGERGGRGAALANPNSRVVWETNENDLNARLHKTVLENPLPDEEIASLDFVSLFSRAAPVLFAVTLQQDEGGSLAPLPKNKIVQRATELPDAVYRREMTVRVTDAAGVVLSNAHASVSVSDDVRTFFLGEYRADTSGKFIVAYPPQEAVVLSVHVGAPGYAAASATFSVLDKKMWPNSTEVRLQHGQSIGGIVLDTSDRPIPGAVIVPYELAKSGPNEFTRTDVDVAESGPDGKWTANVLPQSLSNLTVEVIHPEHHPVALHIVAEELQRTNARIVLKPYLQIAGRVLNTNGVPVPRATVMLSDTDEKNETRVTDVNGRFSFVIREPSSLPATLFFVAANYAPVFRTVTQNVASAVEVKLEPGTPFVMRMNDGADGPVPGALVSFYRWDGKLRTPLRWSAKTDDNGRVRWEHAPVGRVMFRFEKPGYSPYYYTFTLPSKSGEASATYTRPVRIAGNVIDAVTRKPIDSFRVRIRYKAGTSNNSNTTTGRRGLFSATMSAFNPKTFTDFNLTIEATGYDTFTTNSPPAIDSTNNVFALKRGQMLEGTVLSPEGQPVPEAEVVLLNKNASAYMDEPGKFRRNSYSFEPALTDANGQFALTPKTNADILLAAHPKIGFIQMPSSGFTNGVQITLEPWGRVTGVLRVGDKIEPYHYASIHTLYVRENASARSTAPLYIYYTMHPDVDGRFTFDAVPPGERKVQLRYLFQQKETGGGGMRLSHNMPLTVKAGETYDVVIGGEGRTVTGKVKLIGAPGLAIDGKRGSFYMDRFSPGRPGFSGGENPDRRTYFVLFDDNNSFTVPTVPPGKYNLYLQPYDPRTPATTTRTLASLNVSVTVPEGTGSHDLGTFELRVRP